jgi:hypothetical protein
MGEPGDQEGAFLREGEDIAEKFGRKGALDLFGQIMIP